MLFRPIYLLYCFFWHSYAAIWHSLLNEPKWNKIFNSKGNEIMTFVRMKIKLEIKLNQQTWNYSKNTNFQNCVCWQRKYELSPLSPTDRLFPCHNSASQDSCVIILPSKYHKIEILPFIIPCSHKFLPVIISYSHNSMQA